MDEDDLKWVKSKKNCQVLVNKFRGNFRSKTHSCMKIKSVFRDLKWCFNVSWRLKRLNHYWRSVSCVAHSVIFVLVMLTNVGSLSREDICLTCVYMYVLRCTAFILRDTASVTPKSADDIFIDIYHLSMSPRHSKQYGISIIIPPLYSISWSI